MAGSFWAIASALLYFAAGHLERTGKFPHLVHIAPVVLVVTAVTVIRVAR